MQIDRTRFLLLTTAIAAGNAACNPGEAPPPSVAITPDTQDASAGPAAEGMGPAQEGGPTREGLFGPSREGGYGPSREGGYAPTREGAMGPTREGGPTRESGVTPLPTASATAPLPPGCPDSDNMVGTPGSCAGLRAPGPQCESFADTKTECDHYAKGFKPRVAQRAVACLLAKSGSKAICDFQAAQQCAADAAADSCLDPATGPTCDGIMSNCGGRRGRAQITKVQCMHALSALTGSNRSRIATCINESCSTQYCFYDLK